jgi:hypothetical protein
MRRLIFLGFGTLYILSIGTRFYSSDAQVMYETSRALAFDQTFALPDDFGLPQIRRGAGGRWFSQYDPGLPLIAAPVVAVTDWVARVNLWNRYAFSAFSMVWISALGVAFALTALYDLACRLNITRRHALILTLVAGLCTPLWPYARLFFAEGLLAGLITFSFGMSYQARRGSILLAGLSLALAMLIRAATVIYLLPLLWLVMRQSVQHASNCRDKAVPCPGGFLTRPYEKTHHGLRFLTPRKKGEKLNCASTKALPVNGQGLGRGKAVKSIFPLIVFPAFAILTLLTHNLIRYDDPLMFGYAGQSFDNFPLTGAFGLLFSPGRSVFLYAPPLMLSLALFPRFWRANNRMAEAILMAGLIALLFYGSWWAWDGGTSWGPRFLVPLMPLWMLPLGMISIENVESEHIDTRDFRRDTAVPCPRMARHERWLLMGLSAAGFLAAILGVFTDVNRHDVVNYSLAGSPLVGAVKTALAGDIEAPGIFQLQRMGWLDFPATVVPALLVLCSVICFVMILVKEIDEQ